MKLVLFELLVDKIEKTFELCYKQVIIIKLYLYEIIALGLALYFSMHITFILPLVAIQVLIRSSRG